MKEIEEIKSNIYKIAAVTDRGQRLNKLISPMYEEKANEMGELIDYLKYPTKREKIFVTWTECGSPISEGTKSWSIFVDAVKNMKGLFSQEYGYKEPGTHPTNGSIIDISDHYGEWIHYPGQRGFLQGQYSNGIDKRPYINFYGKYETLQEDFDYVCEKIGLPKTKLPHSNKSRNDRNFKYERKLLK